MINFLKQLIKKTFNQIGLDITRISKAPKHTLLGLCQIPIRSVIDVGANRGQFARTISKVFPEADIYCFEPLPEPFKELKQWAKKQSRKVAAFNIALGENEGAFEMFNHADHSPSSSLLKTTKLCQEIYPFTQKQASISVKMTTLDKWSKGFATLRPEILIKLDVQGYEDKVIFGGRETFSMAKACILEVCLAQLYENQADFKDIVVLLSKLGYHYAGNLNQTLADDGHVMFIDAVFVK